MKEEVEAKNMHEGTLLALFVIPEERLHAGKPPPTRPQNARFYLENKTETINHVSSCAMKNKLETEEAVRKIFCFSFIKSCESFALFARLRIHYTSPAVRRVFATKLYLSMLSIA
jgi:hypothetical protein